MVSCALQTSSLPLSLSPMLISHFQPAQIESKKQQKIYRSNPSRHTLNAALTFGLSFKSDNKEKTLTSLEKVFARPHILTAAIPSANPSLFLPRLYDPNSNMI